MEVILMAYPKKFSFRANGPFRIQNVTSCLETGCEISQLWISCKDCFTILHNERDQERHGNYILNYGNYIIFYYNGFFERNLIVFRAIWSFWNKNGMVSSSLWIWSQVFLLILLKKRNQEVHEIFFSCFLRKNFFWGNLIFSSHFLMFDWVWSKLSQATVTIGHCYHWFLR